MQLKKLELYNIREKKAISLEILIMGGTEFVSEALAKYMIEKGHQVSIFTRGVRPVKYSGFTTHYKGDRKSISEIAFNIEGKAFDYVFDISAYTLEDVTNLFQVLDTSKLKRYILCSSGAVYEPSEMIVDETFSRGENKNWGKYGLDKLAIEDYLFELYHTKGIPVTMFRPTYIYGPGNNLYRESYLFDQISNNQPILVPEGDTRVQFLFIEDLLRLFETAMYQEKAIGQAYNVTHKDQVTYEEWVETAAKVMGKKPQMIKIKTPKDMSSRMYFPFRECTYLLDTSKCDRDLLAAETCLVAGLEKTYKWYTKEKPQVTDKRMLEGIKMLSDGLALE